MTMWSTEPPAEDGLYWAIDITGCDLVEVDIGDDGIVRVTACCGEYRVPVEQFTHWQRANKPEPPEELDE